MWKYLEFKQSTYQSWQVNSYCQFELFKKSFNIMKWQQSTNKSPAILVQQQPNNLRKCNSKDGDYMTSCEKAHRNTEDVWTSNGDL